MKTKIFLFSSIIFLAICISCASPGNKLKKMSPSAYEKLTKQFYLISTENPSKISNTFALKENGSVIGDYDNLFGTGRNKWTVRDFPTKMNRRQRENFEKMLKAGLGIDIFDPNESSRDPKRSTIKIYSIKSEADLEKWFSSDMRYVDYRRNFIKKFPPLYRNSIPPLEIMEIYQETGGTGGTSKYYLSSNNLQIIEELFSQVKEITKDWSTVNKQSITELISFIHNCTDPQLKSKAGNSLLELLDKKVIKYISLKHKPYSEYMDYEILVGHKKTKVCTLAQFVRYPIISVNKETKEKMTLKFSKNNSYPNGFDVTIIESGQVYKSSFKPENKKLILMNFSDNDKIEPYPRWVDSFVLVAQYNSNYAKTLDEIDTELLENL